METIAKIVKGALAVVAVVGTAVLGASKNDKTAEAAKKILKK